MTIFVIVLLALGCSSSPDKAEKPVAEGTVSEMTEAQELMVQGNDLLDAGDFAAAARVFGEAASLAPQRWDIHMNRAIALSRENDFNAALGAMEQAFANGGDQEVVTYFNLGNIYQERGMYLQAVSAYRAGLAVVETPHYETLLNLGACYLFLQEFDKAEETYTHLRTLTPDDPRPVLGLGLGLHLQEQYDPALQLYEEAKMIDPTYAQAYLHKARVLGRLDRFSEAIAELEAYLKHEPDGPYQKQVDGWLNSFRQRQ